jgi:hypothetical protein
MVSFRHSGFLWALWFPPPSKFEKFLISYKIWSSEGGFRTINERKRVEIM